MDGYFRHFVQNNSYLSEIIVICPKLSKTYFGHLFVQNLFWPPACPKLILGHLFVQNCPKSFLRHIFVQNLFLVTYLSTTTQKLFKDFEGYIEKALNLVFCYQMLQWEQGVGLSVQRIYEYFSKLS